MELELREDERGFFARTWCEKEFKRLGLASSFVQSSISFNRHSETIRGMHYQSAPHQEIKLVRCTAGTVFDVIVDLRKGSERYAQWHATELSASNHRALYIPAGVGHGFQTLEDDTELLYQMCGEYVPEASTGLRWNDPAIGITWPRPENPTISERDRNFPDFRPTLTA